MTVPTHAVDSGVIGYFGKDGVVTGVERFDILRQADGARTLRARCEMHDDALLREVIYSLDADGRPYDAFVRLSTAGCFVGSTWYRFAADRIECEGYTAGEGRFSQRQDFPAGVAAFGTHSLITDGWYAALWRADGPDVQHFRVPTTSLAANGGTGPAICVSAFALQRLGAEDIRVPAGRFQCDHFGITFGEYPTMHFWVTGAGSQLVRIEWSHLGAYYELQQWSAAE